jgi:hypothetical protein
VTAPGGASGGAPSFALVSSFAEWTCTSTVTDAPPMPWRWGAPPGGDGEPMRPDRVTVALGYSLGTGAPGWKVRRIQVSGVLVADPSHRVEVAWRGPHDPVFGAVWQEIAPPWLIGHVEWVSRLRPGVSW